MNRSEHFATVVRVGAGGFAGATLRYSVSVVVPSSLAATLAVNILGCLALGFLLYDDLYSARLSESNRALVTTGFLGSFTTYSTFVLDALTATPVVGGVYVVGSYVLGFAAVLAGRAGARRVTPAGERTMEVLE